MEKKKSKLADLESKRGTFFLIGLTLSLSVVLFAFRPTSEVHGVDILTSNGPEELEVELIPPTWKKEKVFVMPPKIKTFEKILIVKDDSFLPEIEFPSENIDEPLKNLIDFTTETGGTDETIYNFPSNMPKFPGGLKNLNGWLSNEIDYPMEAIEVGLEGRVYLNFIIDTDGSISSVTVTRGVDKILDDEAIRVIKSMPKWKPGLQNGRPVKVSYSMFISFKLD